MNSQRGFGLIGILITVGIIIGLAGVSLYTFQNVGQVESLDGENEKQSVNSAIQRAEDIKKQVEDRNAEITDAIEGRKISADCPLNFTALQTAGPYYKVGSPNRQSLIEEGVVGEKITVTGFVFDKNCNPISNAWLDFWQADGRGIYDNQGYRLRGYQYTDQNGRYVLETVMPTQYSSRPPHIHLKLQATEDDLVLTSQLYFPRQSQNTADSIFNSTLVVSMSDDGQTANYNFKIDTE